jgi:predicted nucleic acid-binding protein
MKKRNIIFDAGPLINFAMNGLLPVLEKLHKELDGDFLITKEVKREVIDYPLTTKKYELEALQLKQLFDNDVIKHADITPKQVDELRNIREMIKRLANSTFTANGKEIHLLDKGECATLALSVLINQDNVLAVDERTTRMLCENPENLRKLFEKKLHTPIKAKRENYDYFKRFKIIRSTELVYIANKKKLFDIKDPNVLEAALYSLKYHGCSISEEEIKEIKKI